MNIPVIAFGIILALLICLAAILAWKATLNTKSKFDFSQSFLDVNGKTSMAKMGQFSALVVSTWAFVYLTLDGKMTDTYFLTYMGAWVTNGLGSKFLDKKETP